MKTLVLLLLAALGCGRAALQSKCGLRDQLLKKFDASDEDTVAKIVCHAERATGFDTSAVSELNPGTEDPGPAGGAEETWTVYGIFQLSNHLVCSDATTQQPNICGMDCSLFTDGDVGDDVVCVWKIVELLINEGWAARHSPLGRMVRTIFQGDCRNKQAGQYFAECTGIDASK